MTRSQRVRNVHIPLEEGTFRSTGSNGASKIEATIMLRQVLKAMEQMSEDDRAVLALICIEGLSYKDGAAVLAIPIGTLMSRLSRARQKLHGLVHGKDTAHA